MRRLFRWGTYLAAVAVVAMTAAPLYAGSCGASLVNYGRAAYSYNNYAAQTYVSPSYYVNYAAVVPIPVALFQFVDPPRTVVSQTTTTTTTASAVGTSTASAAAYAPPASFLTDAQIDRLADRIVKGLKADAPPLEEGPAPPARTPAKPPEKTAPPMSKAEKEQSSTTPNRVQSVYAVMSSAANRCIACHTEGSEKGKVVIFNKSNQYAPNVAQKALWDQVESGKMPPKGDPLSDGEKVHWKALAAAE